MHALLERTPGTVCAFPIRTGDLNALDTAAGAHKVLPYGMGTVALGTARRAGKDGRVQRLIIRMPHYATSAAGTKPSPGT